MPLIHDPDRRVCQTCNRILDRLNRNWVHPLNALDDHTPVPVLDTEAEPEEHCDFCFDPLTEGYVIPANTFEMMPGQISVTNWLACTACAGLIDADRWSALQRRVKESFEARNGPMSDGLQAVQRAMHRRLRKNITGPLRRVP